MEQTNIGFSPEGSTVTISMFVTLPRLHPGSYAFSPTAGYRSDDGENILTDRIENAVVFEVTSIYPVHALMNFKTAVIVEKISQ
jgi:hypothetical protein